MSATKKIPLALRIAPELKKAADMAAAREHRTLTNLVEFLLQRHCVELGTLLPDGTLPPTADA